MLTEDEKRFVAFWEENRLRRRKISRQLMVGLPAASLLVIAIFVSFFSGWHRQADIELRSQAQSQADYATVILVLMIAGILIVTFMAIFSARHKWEQNEQRYLELKAKTDKP